MNNKNDYIKLIKVECGYQKVDADLFCAIVSHESSWNPNAMKFEKSFSKYLIQPGKHAMLLNIDVKDETLLQQNSFGLCQIMGANARAMAFSEPLKNLLDPEKNIKVGVLFFKKRCAMYPTIYDQMAAWNWGSPCKKPDGTYANQDYVDKVYSYYCELKK